MVIEFGSCVSIATNAIRLPGSPGYVTQAAP